MIKMARKPGKKSKNIPQDMPWKVKNGKKGEMDIFSVARLMVGITYVT